MSKKKDCLNLDALFQHSYNNVVGEPIKPHKIAIVYLIRVLFEIHYGYRAIPSTRPFAPREKTLIFALLHGLITYNQEILYNALLALVRNIDADIRRGVYYDFVVQMDKLIRGEMVDVTLEEAIFSGKREYHDKATYEMPPSKPLRFLTSKSTVGLWLKRLNAQWLRSTIDEKAQYSEFTRQWILRNEIPDYKLVMCLPYEIDCSVRARNFVAKELRLWQTCPTKTIGIEKGLFYCGLIKQRHPDVAGSLLLESVIHIQKRNIMAATASMNEFCDMLMIGLSSNLFASSQTPHLATASDKPLRYAPLLLARLYRIFGQTEMAKEFLLESLQHAQVADDDLCAKMVNVEQNACDVGGGQSPLLNVLPSREASAADKKMRMNNARINLLSKMARCSLYSSEEDVLKDDDVSEGEDDGIEDLTVLNKVLMVASDIGSETSSFFKNDSYDHIHESLSYLKPHDIHNKARTIRDFGMATATMNMHRHGFAKDTMNTANIANACNFYDSRHETESYAVMGVHCAYAYAMKGDYTAALKQIENLEKRFDNNLNWMSTRHVKIAKWLVEFERCLIRHHNLDLCEELLRQVEHVAPVEYHLRAALIAALKGNMSQATTMLEDYTTEDEYHQCRLKMQLIALYTAAGRLPEAMEVYERVTAMPILEEYDNLKAMVSRRGAIILTRQGKHEEALRLLMLCRQNIENQCSFIERATYNYAVAINLEQLKYDSSKLLAEARMLAVKGGWLAMEKTILAKSAAISHKQRNNERTANLADTFQTLNEQCSVNIQWCLF